MLAPALHARGATSARRPVATAALARSALLVAGVALAGGAAAAAPGDARDVQPTRPSAARPKEDRFTSLLIAGRFTDASRLLDAPGARSEDPHPTEAWPGSSATRTAPVAEITPGGLPAARAWLRMAAWDWHAATSFAPAGDRSAAFDDDETTADLLARGLSVAHDAWPRGEPELLDVAHAAADRLEARRSTESRLFQALVLAAVAAAQEEADLVALMIAQAEALDAQLGTAGRSLPPYFQVARLAGDLWLRIHRYDNAVLAYSMAIRRDARDARAWLGLGRAFGRLQASGDARAAYRAFLDLWVSADLDRPELRDALASLAGVQRPHP